LSFVRFRFVNSVTLLLLLCAGGSPAAFCDFLAVVRRFSLLPVAPLA